jgi:hypothetical protein
MRDPLGRLIGLRDPAFTQRLSFRQDGDASKRQPDVTMNEKTEVPDYDYNVGSEAAESIPKVTTVSNLANNTTVPSKPWVDPYPSSSS